MTKTDELFERITDTLIAAIEGGDTGTWSKPWQSVLSGQALPRNAKTNRLYQGMNAIYFWVTQADMGYPEAKWATYKQWAELGYQVAKGEHGTQGIKWGTSYSCETEGGKRTGYEPCGKPGHTSSSHLWASGFTVFNIAQTEGYEPPAVEDLGPAPERFESIEDLFAASGANVRHVAGNRAFYRPGTNDITLPLREQFDTVQGYYGTALHELVHWTGDETRLGRDQKNIFGDEKYAAEELVAEFGSAMLAAHYGVEVDPHMEHAAYLAGWVRVLRSDKMALYRAAKLAQEAVNFLLQYSGEREEAA